MALVFNPFTGNFDNVMASSSDMSFSGGSLNVNGDLTLDSGGTFTTTVQAVPPLTTNRTITFPDQTGTVGLVSGATGNIQYNNAGQLAGTGDLNAELDWTSSTTVYTGLKLNATNTLSAPGSKLVDLQINGTTIGLVDSAGVRFTRTADATVGGNLFVQRSSNHSGFYLFPNNVNNGVGGAPQGFFAGGNAIYGWTAGAVTTSLPTPDTGLSREAAGIVKITAGFSGTGYLKQTPVPFATINAITLSAGIRGLISDSNVAAAGNFGAVVNGNNTGTGNNVVPVYYDGTQWLIG